MKKNIYLLVVFFIFYFSKTYAQQPYYDFPHPSSPGTYPVGGVNVGFNYVTNGGQVYIDHSCPSVLGYNFTNGGYFTYDFNVPIAGVRIRGIRQTFSANTNVAIKINGTAYTLNSTNISSFSACGYTTQGSISNGALVGGNGMITITQPGITSLEVKNNGGDYWIFVVEILPLFTTANTPCAGNTLNLTSDFAGLTSGVTYNWTGPNGFTSSLKNPSISNASAVNSGLYTVTASNGTVTASQTQNAYVNLIPTVNDVNSQTLCSGSSVNAINFSSTSTSGTICGDVNEGGILKLTAPPGFVFTNVPFASYGNATGSCGNFVVGSCNSSNSVNVVSVAAVGQNSFSLEASNANFGDPCIGTAKKLKVQLNYNTPVSYSWTNDNTSIGLAASGTGNIPSFVGTNSTSAPVTATITVTPKYTNGGTSCPGTSKTFTITVNPSPKITVQPTSQSIVENQELTFTVTATNVTSYQWKASANGADWFSLNNDIENSDASGATSNVLTISGNNLIAVSGYKFRVVLNADTCPVTSQEVTATVTTLGTSTFEDTNFSYYPNPTNGILNINYSKDIQQIKVTNMLGQLGQETKPNNKNTKVDLSSLPTGNYFVEVKANEQTKTVKIVKK